LSVWWVKVVLHCWLDTSHNFTVQSADPEAST